MIHCWCWSIIVIFPDCIGQEEIKEYIALNKLEYIVLSYLYGIVFPWNKKDIKEYSREEDLNLVPFESPTY